MVLEKTEGVPFYIEELIRTLMDMKLVVHNDKCCLPRDIGGLVIPSTIQDVIMARVDSLPARAKEVLLIGSVVGREFDYDLIQAVTGLPENELLSLLAVLINSEHIYERIVHAKVTYVFSHGYPARSGMDCSIRRSPDQGVFATPRGLSQLTTSFVANQCQGIHHIPLVF